MESADVKQKGEGYLRRIAGRRGGMQWMFDYESHRIALLLEGAEAWCIRPAADRSSSSVLRGHGDAHAESPESLIGKVFGVFFEAPVSDSKVDVRSCHFAGVQSPSGLPGRAFMKTRSIQGRHGGRIPVASWSAVDLALSRAIAMRSRRPGVPIGRHSWSPEQGQEFK